MKLYIEGKYLWFVFDDGHMAAMDCTSLYGGQPLMIYFEGSDLTMEGLEPI